MIPVPAHFDAQYCIYEGRTPVWVDCTVIGVKDSDTGPRLVVLVEAEGQVGALDVEYVRVPPLLP